MTLAWHKAAELCDAVRTARAPPHHRYRLVFLRLIDDGGFAISSYGQRLLLDLPAEHTGIAVSSVFHPEQLPAAGLIHHSAGN